MSAVDLKAAFAAKAVASAIVEIPGVGRVMVKELTLGDLDDVDYESTSDARAHNVAMSIYTEDGSERVFDPQSQGDLAIIKKLGNKTIGLLTSALAEKN